MGELIRGDRSSESSEPPLKKTKRHVNHVSRACDRCRRRKTRCNGGRPVCDVCTEKGIECEYHEEDKRKTNTEMEELRSRLALLEEVLQVKSSRSPPTKALPPLSQVLSTSHSHSQSQSLSHSRPHYRSRSHSHSNSQLPYHAEAGEEEEEDEERSPSMSFGWADPFRSAEDIPRPLKALPRPVRRHTIVNTTLPRVPPMETTEIGDSDGGYGDRAAAAQSQYRDPTSPLLETSNFERLKRSEDGPHIQFGPTSMWSHRPKPPSHSLADSTLYQPPLQPGDWVDWSRHLPRITNLSKDMHDDALEYFAAFYAPWCMIVDMTAFLREMHIVNLVSRSNHNTVSPSTMAMSLASSSTGPPTRTPNYSPLLHNMVFYLGMYLLKDEWPESMIELEKVFHIHCTEMLHQECDNPSLSTLRALNVLSSCQTMRMSKTSALNAGYIYFGMASAAVQALGVNLNSDRYVRQGQMTEEERDLRDATYWTMSVQDVLRAVAAGRPPMLADSPDISYPKINPVVDEIPWIAPSRLRQGAVPSSPGMSINGVRGLRSTVFHWTVRLCTILRGILATMYSVRHEHTDRDALVVDLSHQLEDWHSSLPLPSPEFCPLPHILILHMLYYSATIFLHRPFYRSEGTKDFDPAQKCDHAADSMMHLLRTFESIHGVRNGPMTLITNTFAVSTIFLLRSVCLQGDEEALKADIANVDECVTFMSRLALTWNEAHRGLEVLISMRNEWLPSIGTMTANATGILNKNVNDSLNNNANATIGQQSSLQISPFHPPEPSNTNSGLLSGHGLATSTISNNSVFGNGVTNNSGTGFGSTSASFSDNPSGNAVGFGVNGYSGNANGIGNPTMGELPMELHEWLMSQDLLDVMFPNGGLLGL